MLPPHEYKSDWRQDDLHFVSIPLRATKEFPASRGGAFRLLTSNPTDAHPSVLLRLRQQYHHHQEIVSVLLSWPQHNCGHTHFALQPGQQSDISLTMLQSVL